MSGAHVPADQLDPLDLGDWLLLNDIGDHLVLRRLRVQGTLVREVMGTVTELLPPGADDDARPPMEGVTPTSFDSDGAALDECRRRLATWQDEEGWVLAESSEIHSGMATHFMDNALLGVSIVRGDPAIVQQLRDAIARREQEDARTRRIEALWAAIGARDHAQVRSLLEEHDGAPLYMGLTTEAVATGDRELVTMVLDAGSPLEEPGRASGPLATAAETNDVPMMRLLLERGADVDIVADHGRRALHEAAVVGAVDAVAVLLDDGADTSLEDRWGHSAVELAAEHGHEAVVELLLPRSSAEHRRRAEAKLPDGLRRRERSTELDPRTGQLLWAAFRNRPEVIRRLLEAGVSVNARSPDGRSAWDVAVERGFDELADMLVDAGAE